MYYDDTDDCQVSPPDPAWDDDAAPAPEIPEGMDENKEDEADVDETVVVMSRRQRRTKRMMKKKKTKKKRHRISNRPVNYAAAARHASDSHVDLMNKEALQQMIKEESDKRIVKAQEVRQSSGAERERWKLAAESELINNFVNQAAFRKSTAAERKKFGTPLPMLCARSKDEALDYWKSRACVCGNFATADPTAQPWTAQAEPSSLVSALKFEGNEQWTVSKHDVKGAFLNANIPDGKLVVVSPPKQWVEWGLVKEGTTWTLIKAVYGCRESPRLWSEERDRQFLSLTCTVGDKTYYLKRCSGDSQLWILTCVDSSEKQVAHGVLVVYVDDFLLQAEVGLIGTELLVH